MPSDTLPKADEATLRAIKKLQFPQNLRILTSHFCEENASELQITVMRQKTEFKLTSAKTVTLKIQLVPVCCLSYYDKTDQNRTKSEEEKFCSLS